MAVALVFKVIENKLKSAGKQKPKEQPDWAKQLTEVFGSEESEVFPTIASDEDFQEEDIPYDVQKPAAIPVVTPVVAEKPRPAGAEEAPRAVLEVNDQIPIEETDREKIDPKKLVVYSEIMKPKYLE